MSTFPVTVIIKTARGRVEVLGGGRRMFGRLGNAPGRLRLGDEVHVLLRTSEDDGRLALLGRVRSFDGVANRLDVRAGQSFELQVLMLVKDGLDVAPGVVFHPEQGDRRESGPDRRGPARDREETATLSVTGIEPSATSSIESSEALGLQRPANTPLAPTAMKRIERSVMAGSLDDMNLVDLVQSMELCRKTACIELNLAIDRHAAAEVFVEEGAVVHAFYNHLVGKEAFFELTQAEHGHFRVRFGEKTSARSVSVPSAFLIMDALRQIDEGRRFDDEGTETRVAPPPAPLTAMESGWLREL